MIISSRLLVDSTGTGRCCTVGSINLYFPTNICIIYCFKPYLANLAILWELNLLQSVITVSSCVCHFGWLALSFLLFWAAAQLFFLSLCFLLLGLGDLFMVLWLSLLWFALLLNCNPIGCFPLAHFLCG